MRIWSLGTGSSGNALLIECGDKRLLVDAGFSARTLAARLRAIGVAPASVAACVVTHEHADHVKGAAAAAARWGWTIHASAGTAAQSPELAGVPVQPFSAGATLAIGRADVMTVRVSHDATEPVGVVVTDRASGARAAIVYDLGCGTNAVMAALQDLDVLVLESNHDEGMLRAGPYPPFLRSRIGCRTGHLSNRAAASIGVDCAHGALQHVVLAHLSEANNDPGLAMGTMTRALLRTRFRGQVSVASQHATAGPFTPRSGRRPAMPEQLSFL